MDLLHVALICIICVNVSPVQSSSEDTTIVAEDNSSTYLAELFVGAVQACFSVAAWVEMMISPSPNPSRIPGSVVPLHYNVYLANDPENWVAWGSVHILMHTADSAESFVLHAIDLDLDEETLIITDESTGRRVGVKSLDYELHNQWYVIEMMTSLQKNKHYTVSVDFKREQARRNDGLAWFKYTSGNNTRWIVASQFEPSYARNVFPCFDEPALKARFNISIATPPGMHALSNMPLRDASESVSKLPGWVWSHFEESKPMSTYLVAFVITDFVQVQSQKPSNFSVWVPSGLEEHVKLVANMGPDIIAVMEEFTGIKYQLPKLDNVLILGPASEDYSGMENWGLIIYRNNVLLSLKGRSSTRDIRDTFEIVSHEVAHMWFGNLVTPAWWDHLWLKEGFADFCAFFGLAKVLGDKHPDADFVIRKLQPTFLRDTGLATIQQTTANIKEIEGKYGWQSYDKGAVIIRMMEHILSPSIFQAGVRQYLQEYSYRAAAAKDLFRILEAAAENHPDVMLPSEVGLAELINPWISLGGFPLITVTRNYDIGEATVCQEVFNSARLGGTNSTWWVPLSYTTESEADFKSTTPRLWLPANQTCIIITGLPGKDQWVIFNIQETGYYRVNYDVHNWQLLVNYLNSDQYSTIHATNRAQLMDDAFNLLKYGLLDFHIFHNITRYLHRETSPIPWLALLEKETLCYHLREETELLERAVALSEAMEDEAKEEGTSHVWYSVMESACDKSCSPSLCWQDAYDKFAAQKQDPVKNRINPDKQQLVLCGAMRDERATVEDVDYLWEMAHSSRLQEERYEVALALQDCTTNGSLQQRFMVLLSSEEENWYSPEETGYLILSACSKRNAVLAVPHLLEIYSKREHSLPESVMPALETLTSVITDYSGPDGEMGKALCGFLATWINGLYRVQI